ncbi:MAG: tape measure protein [Polynucleobacter sp.]
MADRIELEATIDAASVNKYLNDLKTGVEGTAQALNKALGGSITKKVVIETKVDESGAKKLVAVERERLSVVDKITNLQRKNDNVQAGSLTSLRQALNQAKQQRDGLAKYSQDLNNVGSNIKIINSEWTAANQRVSELGRQISALDGSGFWSKLKTGLQVQGVTEFLDGLARITQGLQAVTILFGQFTGAVNTVVKTAADLQAFGLSFQAIGQGAGGAAIALKESQRIALGLGTNLNTVQDAFRQLSPVILNSGGSLSDVSGIVETLSSRFAAFGISGDRARRVTNGIIQAFAKGKLQAEELTQQISEADPAFKTDLAGAIGVSVEKLEALVKAGKITGSVLLENIPKISKSALLFGKLGKSGESALKALGSGSVTIDQVKNQLASLNQLSLRRLATSFTPVINAFIGLQGIVTDFFTRITKSSNLEAIGRILGSIGQAGNRLISVFLSFAEAVLSVVNAIAPLIDKLTSIPGVLEFIGLAVVGKFLKPFGQVTPVLSAATSSILGFARNLKTVFDGPNKSAEGYIKTFNKVSDVISKPIEAASIGNVSSEIKGIEPVASATINKIDKKAQKQINGITSRIQNLQSALKNLGAPPILNVSNIIAAETAVQGYGNRVDAAAGIYRKLATEQELAAKAGKKSSKEAIGFLAAGKSLLTSRLDAPPIVTPETLQGLKELSKKDPALAMTLLKSALAQVNAQLKQIRPDASISALRGDKDSAKYKETAANYQQLKTALIEVKTASKDFSGEQSQSAQTTEALAKATKEHEQALKAYNDKYNLLTASLKTARSELKSFVKEQAKGGRVSGIAKDPGIGLIRERINLEEQYGDKARNSAIKAALASNNVLASLEKEIKLQKQRLDQLGKYASKAGIPTVDQAQASGASPEVLKSATAVQAASDRLRGSIAKLTNEYNVQQRSVIGTVSANNNLSKAIDAAGKSNATAATRAKALTLLQNAAIAKYNEESTAISGLKQKIAELNQERAGIISKQAIGGGFDPTSAEKNAEALKKNGEAAASASAALKTLEASNVETSGAITTLAGEIRKQEDVIKGSGQSSGVFSKGLKQVGGAASGTGRILGAFAKGGLGLVASAASSATGALRGLFAALGPLGVALAGLAVVQKAYNDANKESAAINEETTETLKALEAALKDARGAASGADEEEAPLTGFALAWERISLFVDSAANNISNFFAQFSVDISGATSKLNQFLAALALIGAGAGVGFALGGPIGAVVGAIAGLFGVALSQGQGVEESLTRQRKEVGALSKGYKDVVDKLKEIRIEIDKLQNKEIPQVGGRQDPVTGQTFVFPGDDIKEDTAAIDERKRKLISLYEAQKTGVDELKSKLEQLEKIDAKNAAGKERSTQKILELGAEQITLAKDVNALEAKRKRQRGSLSAAEAAELREKKGRLNEVTVALQKEREVRTGYNNKLYESKAASNAVKTAYEEEKAALDRLRESLGFAKDLEEDPRLNSLDKAREGLKALQDEANQLDLLRPQTFARFRQLNEEIAAIENTLKLIQRTDIEIKLKTKDLQQSIAESQITINLDPGPLRESLLLISQVTNDVESAGLTYIDQVNKLEIAESKGVINAQTKAKLIQEAALEYVSASEKGRANIIEAARTFKDQLIEAQFALQDLKLSKPGFFTRGELAQNEREIIKSYNDALAKVRRDTGDFNFTPTLDRSSKEALLKSAAEFVRTRKQADDLGDKIGGLRKAIQELAKAINNLDKKRGVLAGEQGATADGAGAGAGTGAGAPASAPATGSGQQPYGNIVQGAVEAQGAVTGLGNAYGNNQRKYDTWVGAIEAGGKRVIIAWDNVQEKYVELTESQYQAGGGAANVFSSSMFTNLPRGAEVNALPSEDIVDQARQAGRQAGGDFSKAMAIAISRDQLFAQGILGNLGTAATEYKAALETLAISQQQAKDAQAAFNAELQTGGPNLYTAAGALYNANEALAASEEDARRATAAYQEASTNAKNLGINMDSVLVLGQTMESSGPKNLGEVYDEASKKVYQYYQQLQQVPEETGNLESSTGAAEGNLDTADSNASALAGSLEQGAGQAQAIANAIAGIDDVTVTVRTIGTQGLWTGGPTQAGVTYRVNELGQEGFLNSAGKLTMINKPKNALWRAPSAGTVIPAHIMSSFNIPSGGVKVGAQPSMSTTTNSGVQKIAKAIQMGLAARTRPDTSMHELAAVQAGQAQQIGRLSHAIDKLNEKDWNVKVKVNASGGLHYMNALNSRL